MLGTFAFSQVVFQVQQSVPASLQGSYAIEWADPAGGDWTTPDLNIPANSVTDTLVFVDDGDAGLDAQGNPSNQDGCSTGNATPSSTINNVAGKIAVLYRGDCQFGHKAAAVENAGAVACIIINHTGAPVGMAGGDSGLVVTIPVIMISEQDGALLQSAIANGDITQAFIGSKQGLFADDLGSRNGDVLRARRFSNLANLSQGASEFSVPVGAWVRNYGSQTQTGAELKCVINNGSVVYADSVTIPSVNTGDSVFVSLPIFSLASYPVGYYQMTYTVTTTNTDEEPSDNTIDASFMINDSLYSYGRLDPVTNLPLSPGGFRSGDFTSDWEGCLAFQDPNASRMMAMGMTYSATTSSTETLINEFVEARVYQWDDSFTDIEDPNFAIANLTPITSATGFYIYATDLQDSNIYIPYQSPVILQDNQRYLFCLNTSSEKIFAGYDTQLDYTTTQDDGASGANGAHLQPSTPGASDGTYFLNGFGLDVQIAASIKMDINTSIEDLGKEETIVPYPNPVNDVLNIPIGERDGTAMVELFDVAGKLVLSKKYTFNKNNTLTLNISNINNGSYICNMAFENGTTSKFNLVISKQ